MPFQNDLHHLGESVAVTGNLPIYQFCHNGKNFAFLKTYTGASACVTLPNFPKVEQPTISGGKEIFQKKPLGRRRYLISSFARSETANLVPLRLSFAIMGKILLF